MRKIREKMTDRRRAWLTNLLDGPAARKGRTDYDCAQIGWTRWAYDDYGDMLADASGNWMSEITDKGRAALASNAELRGASQLAGAASRSNAELGEEG